MRVISNRLDPDDLLFLEEAVRMKEAQLAALHTSVGERVADVLHASEAMAVARAIKHVKKVAHVLKQ
jgi:hypothetical protein